MGKLIFTYFLFIFLLAAKTSYAGVTACHDGSGNITSIDFSSSFSSRLNCSYYEINKNNVDDLEYSRLLNLKSTPIKYIKWNTKPIEMTEVEKDAVDQTNLTKQLESDKLIARSNLDGNSSDALTLRCTINTIISEINELRTEPLRVKQPKTLNEIKLSIKNCISNETVKE